jgi:hypothetical protein
METQYIVNAARPRSNVRVNVERGIYLNSPGMPALVLNLSEHGMAIQTTESLAPGDVFSFACPLPDTQREVQGLARVVWTDREGRAGMQFTDLCDFDRFQLREWVLEVQSRLLRGAHAIAS